MPDPGAKNSSELVYRYTFIRGGGEKREFVVRLDEATLAMVPPARETHPDWTALEFHACRDCPLDPARHARCPVAVNIADVVDFLRDIKSFETVDVRVESRQRAYLKRTTMQVGASALLGLIMATSGCPILDRLRPMAEVHLPFSNPEETVFRMVTMYLAAQYFRRRRGEDADAGLDGLTRFLHEIQRVNSDFVGRLRATRIEDAGLNAVDTLNTMGVLAQMSITEDNLERLAKIFEAHAARPMADPPAAEGGTPATEIEG